MPQKTQLPRISLRFCAVLLSAWIFASLSACSYFRLPVLQGNVVEPEKAEQLQIGMTPKQVEFLLGTPLIQESFGRPRWDYVVYYRNPGDDVYQQRLSVFFADGKVSELQGLDRIVEARKKLEEAKERAAEQIRPQHEKE